MNEIIKIEELAMPKDMEDNNKGFVDYLYILFIMGNFLFWTFVIVFMMEVL